MIEQIRKIGWLTVEAGLLLVVLCILLNIIVGQGSDSYVSSVADNATRFLQQLPSGVTVGLALIAFLYWFVKGGLR